MCLLLLYHTNSFLFHPIEVMIYQYGSIFSSFLYNYCVPGKNAYAMSVLRRVEMKLDGQDIANNRCIFPDTLNPLIILCFC